MFARAKRFYEALPPLGIMVTSFMSGPGLDLAGKHGRKTMIRKKWRDGEVVLSIETEDEFDKALATGEAVEIDAGAGGSTRDDGR